MALGDREVQCTMVRLWAALSTKERLHFVWLMLQLGLFMPSKEKLKEEVEALKNKDALTEAFESLVEELPSLLRPLIHERDEYMVAQLRAISGFPGVTNVVAVVGAGHVQGIKDKWEAEIDVEESRASGHDCTCLIPLIDLCSARLHSTRSGLSAPMSDSITLKFRMSFYFLPLHHVCVHSRHYSKSPGCPT